MADAILLQLVDTFRCFQQTIKKWGNESEQPVLVSDTLVHVEENDDCALPLVIVELAS